MIEEIIISYLSGKLTVPVYAEVPEDAPDKFCVVEKTSGSVTNHIQSAMVAIQSYAGTLYEAAALNESVKAAMDDLTADATADVSRCALESDYNFTDTTTRRYRYQAMFALVY